MTREEAGRLAGLASKTHGMSYDPIYNLWASMMTRCYNENFEKFYLYGGRGITVCERWHSFENWYEDIGKYRPEGYSLDRMDTDGNYEPSNCRWASIEEQNRNRRNVIKLTINGLTKSATEWARERGIAPSTVCRRYKRGLPAEECIL